MRRTVILILTLAAGQHAAAREWTTAAGFKFEADLIDIRDDAVRLRLDDGPITIPRDLLSSDDQRFIVNERNRRTREAERAKEAILEAARDAIAPDVHKLADQLEAQATAGLQRMKHHRATVDMYLGFRAHEVYGNFRLVYNHTLKADELYKRLKVEARVLRKSENLNSDWFTRWGKKVEVVLRDVASEEAAIEREVKKFRMVPVGPVRSSPYKPGYGAGPRSF